MKTLINILLHWEKLSKYINCNININNEGLKMFNDLPFGRF